MSEVQDKPDGKRRGRRTAAWIVVVFLVLYPLSAGPAWAIARHFDCVGLFNVLYAPVIWPCEMIPPLFAMLLLYLEFWASIIG
jgi:hypothetical protein